MAVQQLPTMVQVSGELLRGPPHHPNCLKSFECRGLKSGFVVVVVVVVVVFTLTKSFSLNPGSVGGLTPLLLSLWPP